MRTQLDHDASSRSQLETDDRRKVARAEQHIADLGAQMEAAPGTEIGFLHPRVIRQHQTILIDIPGRDIRGRTAD